MKRNNSTVAILACPRRRSSTMELPGMKAIMIKRRITQDMMAKELGTNRNHVSDYMRGVRGLTDEKLAIICRVLRCEVEDLAKGVPIFRHGAPKDPPLLGLGRMLTERNISQTAFALTLGIEPGVVSKYCAGKICPRHTRVAEICKALNCTVKEIQTP